nr:protein MOS2 [Ipomoea batatas]
MKLSFSLASKPSSNLKKPSQTFARNDSKASASAAKEYVTEFDASKAPAAADSVANYIIPPKANEWEPRKRMKNIDLPPIRSSDDQPLQFEVDTGSSVEPSSDSVSYGLNIRQSTGKTADDPNTDKSENPNPSPNVDPMLHRLKEDLMRLPDDNGMDEFTDMPVEGFGAALLKGYGWSEGRGIGRNAKEDVKVREYKRWSAKEGIGFTAELPNDTKVHKVDGGEKKEERGEKEGKGLFVGKNIRIVGEVKSGGNMVIRLSSDDREVIVQASDVAELGSVEEEKCMRKLKELKIKDSNKDSSSVRHRRESRDDVTRDRENREERSRDRRKDSKRSRDESNAKGVEQISWLTSHIRVRVISKALKGGKLYLKKGEVVDVVGPSTCDISMDESRELIQGVNQNQLETALPRHGGPVLVLCGRHKGGYGSLVERDTEKETGVVRHADTHELLNVRLEQIAEYTGDPSYIGY